MESICSIERYRQAVEQARLLLEGRQDELIDRLRSEMQEASAEQRYERAAHLRDAIRTVETLRDRQQKLDTPTLGDRDAFGIKVGTAGAIVQIFQMRHGRVVDRTELVTESGGSGRSAYGGPDATPAETDAEVVAAALQQFYAEREPPPEVHVPVDVLAEDHEALEAWLSDRAGRRVRITVPRRGEKRGLLDLASRNAAMAYQTHFSEGAVAAFEALDMLRGVLSLPSLPRRIECFDISTLQGRETVGSMVVCLEGRMRRSEYRKFRIRGAESGLGPQALGLREPPSSAPRLEARGLRSAEGPKPDDFAAIEEVVLRRYRRLLEQGGPFPDLIVIDGGKGQLTAAYAALRQLGSDRLVAIGLAKQEELLFTRDRPEGIALPRESPALQLLQRIRDEAHRFAVTFHRRARRMRDFRSALDDIQGIGAHRRRVLLTTFGSVAGVRRASREELAAVVGAKAAEAVLRHFAGS